MKPRMVKLSNYGQNSDSAMFDFLKDGTYTGNKYKSTSQIPCFTGEDLFGNRNTAMNTSEDTHMRNGKEEIFTPFFSIEEDMEMEDAVSNSDEVLSEAEPESVQSYFCSFASDFKNKQPKRYQSTKQATPFLGLFSRRANVGE
uniref:Uncharacterized protein n=1 Tax=Euplotes harpa TaxID=151035 RepID=A0A7S3JHR9_9SPIT|mmetsp:Transcript_4132/g.5037  ORF Transcript_4132/g.5037 Transcript_4132/m.5037 type:complete len:143 (+) Transcript_4132:70-498(+)